MDEIKTSAAEIVRELRSHGEGYLAYKLGSEFAHAVGEAAELIETLEAQLYESQRREQAAVEAIRQSLSATGNQRPHLNRCSQCAKFVTDRKQRKYKYGCESLCADALKVIVACGFKSYEPLIPFADEWRGPQAGEGGE